MNNPRGKDEIEIAKHHPWCPLYYLLLSGATPTDGDTHMLRHRVRHCCLFLPRIKNTKLNAFTWNYNVPVILNNVILLWIYILVYCSWIYTCILFMEESKLFVINILQGKIAMRVGHMLKISCSFSCNQSYRY